jgi:hypothetical protein
MTDAHVRASKLHSLPLLAEQARRQGARSRPPSDMLLRLAARIARQHEWCDPKRVAECYGCACRRDARRALRGSQPSKAARRGRAKR